MNINVKYLMLILTFVDMIIMAVFLLVLSSNSTKQSVSINNVMNEQSVIGEETEEWSTEKGIIAEENIGEPQIISKEDYMSNKNTSKITSIYARQIIGNFHLANGMWFDFEPDGVFNGFLDYNSPSISNGYYEIMTVDETPIINIYNSEMTAKVSYSLIINNDHIILCYEAAGINIELENDN